jgi:hypothetical protein
VREEDEEKYGRDDVAGEGEDIIDVTVAESRAWHERLLGVALVLLALLTAALLAFIAWWQVTLRGLDTATNVYEQIRRIGRFLGVPHQAHQTPNEYGESLVAKLARGGEEVRRLVALYAKQRFSWQGLNDAEEEELGLRWQRLRGLMWRQVLVARRPKRKRRTTPARVPASSLRPPSSLN